jgi:hypothetical protein
MKRPHSRIPAGAVLAGVTMAAAVVVFSSLRYPATFRLSGADIVLVLTMVMLAGYAACGTWALRRPAGGYRTGLIWGGVAGAMWSAEIWCGGAAKLPHSAEKVLGATFVLLAVVATVTAGVRAAARTGRADTAWRAGLFSGLVSGLVVYAFGMVMTLSTLPVLASRGDYQAEFARSHAPNIATYLVGDMLAGVAAHLVINLILGLVGGGIGAVTARYAGLAPSCAAPRRRRREKRSRWGTARLVGRFHAAALVRGGAPLG